jgi:hypothetical protein
MHPQLPPAGDPPPNKRFGPPPSPARTPREGRPAVTIRHTRAEGTLIEGSRKGGGVWEVLHALRANWGPFRSLGQLGLGQSRDRAAKTYRIEQAATALRDAGYEVSVEIDDTTPGRPFADQESGRYDCAADRADYHGEHAGKAAAASEAAYRAEHGILDVIPPGQPVLAGHHSERRHRRDLERADALRRRGRAEAERSGYHADRAGTANRYQERRESVPTTLRRIAGLEAEQRRVQRGLDGGSEDQPAAGACRDRLNARAAEINGELAYWRRHIEQRQAQGTRVWGPADFTPGDYALSLWGLCEVLRVNPRSVTIPDTFDTSIQGPVSRAAARAEAERRHFPRMYTRTVPYNKITGRKTAAEVAELLARADVQDGAS